MVSLWDGRCICIVVWICCVVWYIWFSSGCVIDVGSWKVYVKVWVYCYFRIYILLIGVCEIIGIISYILFMECRYYFFGFFFVELKIWLMYLI